MMYRVIILFMATVLLTSCMNSPTTRGNSSSSSYATRDAEVVFGDEQTYPRIALVMGNNRYQKREKLTNAVPDARAMRDFLKNRDFKVVYAENADRETMQNRINEFMDGLDKKSVAVIYYSGHASQDKSRRTGEATNYLLPINDSSLTSITDYDRDAISMNYILNKADELNRGLNIAMLDACRTPIGRGGNIQNIGAEGVYLVYSTASGVTASDSGGFRKSFLKYANQPLKLTDIFGNVKLDLRKEGQRPSIQNDIVGDFYFTQVSKPIPTIKPTPTPIVNSQVVGRKAVSPPQVRILNASSTITQNTIDIGVEICERDGGVENITFYIDDKPLKYIGKTLKTMKGCAIIEQKISVPKGKHTIGVDATNQEGDIHSNKATITITNKKSILKKPNLHLLTISINDYKDNKLNLKFPNKDAIAISSKFKEIGKPIFKNIYTYSLKDTQVTKWQMGNKFKEIAQNIEVNDVFILYISGHGTTDNLDGNYYFIPYNYSSGADITKDAISQQDFKTFLSQIKAVKSVILLETCESGSMASKELIGTSVNRFGGNVGSAIITATSSKQSAIDGYKGHGLFTYTLLDAMSNEMAYGIDSELSIYEMANYIKFKLPRLSKKAFNHEQKPTIYMNGDTSFAIGEL